MWTVGHRRRLAAFGLAVCVLIAAALGAGCRGIRASKGATAAGETMIPVAEDRQVTAATQAQVDQGHQPWRLDPLQTAMAFIAAKHGNAAVQSNGAQVVMTGASSAVVDFPRGPVKRVHLERAFPERGTASIWITVGYVPR